VDYKKKVMETVEDLLDNDGQFMIIGSNKPAEVIIMHGKTHDLARALGLGMAKDESIEKVVSLAKEGFDFAIKEVDKHELRKEAEGDCSDGPLPKCKTCDIRESCPIVNDDVDPLKALITLLGKVQEKAAESRKENQHGKKGKEQD